MPLQGGVIESQPGIGPQKTKTQTHILRGLSLRVVRSASRTRTYNPAVTVDSETFALVRTISSPLCVPNDDQNTSRGRALVGLIGEFLIP
jgi:hypothetical protein